MSAAPVSHLFPYRLAQIFVEMLNPFHHRAAEFTEALPTRKYRYNKELSMSVLLLFRCGMELKSSLSLSALNLYLSLRR